MNANDKKLVDFMEGHDKRFIIPVYQRNYDWKKDHCEKLFNDLIEIHQNKKSHADYFIGSIVSIYNKNNERIIIDGQQRLTTVTLMLLAIHNMLEAGEFQSKNSNLAETIREVYLENKHSPQDKKIRLKPIDEDNNAFIRIFERDPDQFEQDSNITRNYLYLSKLISQELQNGTDPEDIYLAIKQLMIVDIELTLGQDNPQAIFESINSTGMQLSQADLVRNFILMNQPPEEQERLYRAYWHPIEKNTRLGKNATAGFLRDWLTLKQKKYPKETNVYSVFKKYVHSQGENYEIEDLLKELLNYSKGYFQFTGGEIKNSKVRQSTKRLRKMEQGTFNPLLLEVFEQWRLGELNDDELARILITMESFAMRRLICAIPTHGLNKFIPTIPSKIRHQIKRAKNQSVNYVDILEYYIKSGTGSNRFPNDEEFMSHLKTRNIYSLKPKNRTHFFQRLENNNGKEKIDLEIQADDKNYLSIEHIMPQTLTPLWKEELGAEALVIHDEYLHRLGNLTLTFHNPEMQNRSFQDKKSMKDGYNDSKLWLNGYLQKQDHWTETQIKNRGEILAKRANALWALPQSEFTPASPEEEPISFYEDFDFTGRVPKAFYFKDYEFEVESWRDILRTCLNEMHDENREALRRASHNEYYLHIGENHGFRAAEEVAPGVYFEVNLSAQAIADMIQRLSDALEYDEDEIMVLLTPVTEKDLAYA